jgi:hypothetical protein
MLIAERNTLKISDLEEQIVKRCQEVFFWGGGVTWYRCASRTAPLLRITALSHSSMSCT